MCHRVCWPAPLRRSILTRASIVGRSSSSSSSRDISLANGRYRIFSTASSLAMRVASSEPGSAASTSHQSRQAQASAIVVGGGAAGVAVLGSLLEHWGRLRGGGRVAWVDPDFTGGRVNGKYREVPSNTKVDLFLTYARSRPAFREIIAATPTPHAVTALEALPGDETCSLRYAADLLRMLSDGLVVHDQVDCFRGRVTRASWNESKREWSLTMQRGADSAHGETVVTAPLVIYCTGSSPTTVPLPTALAGSGGSGSSIGEPAPLDLDVALTPTILAATLPRDKPVTVAVIGASHSAVLVLMNLCRLAREEGRSGLRVVWFVRSRTLRYAIYKDGWILYDNTGLKGEAAEFGRTQLDGDRLERSDAGRVIRRVDCSGGVESEREAMRRELGKCQHVVQAVGFTRNPLPDMDRDVDFDHTTGQLVTAGAAVPGLFGAGIAFPERVVDRAGNVEYSVGFFKFIKFLDRVLPEWVAGGVGPVGRAESER